MNSYVKSEVKQPLIFLRFLQKTLDKSAKKCCRALIIRHFYGGADMSFIVTEIRQNLFSVLESLLARRDEFLKNPSSDFTRKRRFPLLKQCYFR